MYIISNQEWQEVSNWSVISKKTKIIDQSSACHVCIDNIIFTA